MKNLLGQLNQRTMILLGIIAILLIYLFIVSPLQSGWLEIGGTLNKKETSYYQKLHLVNQMGSLKKEFQPYEEAIRFGEKESEEQVNAVFLKTVEEFVQGAGLKIVDVKVLPIMVDGKISHFYIQIESEGNMDLLSLLLHNVAESDSLIQIENLSLERKDAGSDTLLISTIFSKIKMN